MLAAAPPGLFLPVFKSANSVHAVPFQDSFVLAAPLPPNDKADVEDPAEPCEEIATFKSFSSVQLDPLYNSVSSLVDDGVLPPKAKAAV